jgi:hypothetical protein
MKVYTIITSLAYDEDAEVGGVFSSVENARKWLSMFADSVSYEIVEHELDADVDLAKKGMKLYREVWIEGTFYKYELERPMPLQNISKNSHRLMEGKG